MAEKVTVKEKRLEKVVYINEAILVLEAKEIGMPGVIVVSVLPKEVNILLPKKVLTKVGDV